MTCWCKLHRTAVLAGDRMACIALAVEADPWTLPAYLFRFDGGQVRLRRAEAIRCGGDLEAVEFHIAVAHGRRRAVQGLDSGGHRRL